ncbi:ATP-binding cassette domain-containing protein [Treponema parvum]|uniref:ATP-binding cassette domain-containing protein n=1 Tax=Treponema parvum TaxID=138851 RepID=A0A975EY91_9SPIR|nr:ATP-binding cassette domain-containing protein [Treponema parvum]QTQ11048.1 ATP-binding cassette domain-containing protein [Treponema parvum]QTQ17007.1 ATP-binding cassette domain-containing protein [Treponema parvum]
MAESAVIELKNISFAAQGNKIVDNVSYSFEEGKATAIVGPSGGGKSSILKLAAGLLLPVEGSVSYNGRDIFLMTRRQTLEFRRRCAFVFQDSALWANQTVRQILELPLKVHFPKMSLSERVKNIERVLKDVGYKKPLDIRPSALSVGEQKLIAFARAMLCDPDLIFLDECTESLDDSSSRRLVKIIKQKKQEKKTMIFVSHDLNVIKALADIICLVVEGKISLAVSGDEIARDEDLIAFIEKGIAI